MSNGDLERSPLGHATGYPDTYDPTQLFGVPRASQRATLGLTGALPFTGSDLWTAYELTWLDSRGKPVVAIATIEVPADSPSIVETKSMKLYLVCAIGVQEPRRRCRDNQQ
jgi:7-cyano-7-deazaguanine reductase